MDEPRLRAVRQTGALIAPAGADALLLTCEHGGNRIPEAYRSLFRGQRALLASHRGYDPGALLMARTLAQAFAAPLVSATTSRLLIDLNRSIGHPRVFSEFTRRVSDALRAEIVARYYVPYRTEVESLVRQTVAKGRRVIHVSSHSFTPVLEGTMRHADVGLLYDPARSGEVALCARWKAALAVVAPGLRVRRNYPYAGKGDGQTSSLRDRYAPGAYVGVELEINQRIVFSGGAAWGRLRSTLVSSLRAALSARAAFGAL